jgi:uncharacterized protein (TIGR00730 family)
MAFRIGVFGSSASATNPKYCNDAFKLGELIASAGHICVNGAGKTGVMGNLNKGCRSKNGKIRGVIHECFIVDKGEDHEISDMLVVTGRALNERKDALLDESDCLIVMPGGVGTFDELCDSICAKSLKMKDLGHKPICIVNINGFYDGFFQLMHRAYHDGILYMPVNDYFKVVDDVESAVDWVIAECNRIKSATTTSTTTAVTTIVTIGTESSNVSRIQQRKTEVTVASKEDDHIQLETSNQTNTTVQSNVTTNSRALSMTTVVTVTATFSLVSFILGYYYARRRS